MRSAQLRAEKITKHVFAKNRITAGAWRIERSYAADLQRLSRPINGHRSFRGGSSIEAEDRPHEGFPLLESWIGVSEEGPLKMLANQVEISDSFGKEDYPSVR